MADIVVIGDVMLDRILRITDNRVLETINEQDHTISFPFPIKMQLTEAPLTRSGGNALNASKAIQKLGLNSSIFTIMGKDMDGEILMKDLRSSDINVDMVVQDNENPSNSSYIMSFGSDRIVFSYHYPRAYELKDFPDVKYVFLTSLGEDDKHLFDQVIKLKAEKNFFLVFSPGTRQIVEEFTDVKDVLQQTDLLILNKQEAKDLSRLQSDSNEHLLQGLHNMGPRTVIMTRSNHGSIAFDGNNYTKVGALQVEPVETTGAGDCYAATVTAALMKGKDLTTAMQWGSLNAANVVLSVGGTNGQLKLDELEKTFIEKVSQLQYFE